MNRTRFKWPIATLMQTGCGRSPKESPERCFNPAIRIRRPRRLLILMTEVHRAHATPNGSAAAAK